MSGRVTGWRSAQHAFGTLQPSPAARLHAVYDRDRRLDEAQRMAGQLNQDANALAADASQAIHDVLDTTVKH